MPGQVDQNTVAQPRDGQGQVVEGRRLEIDDKDEDGPDSERHANAYPAWLERVETKLKIRPVPVQPLPKLERPIFPTGSQALTGLLRHVPRKFRWCSRWLYVAVWVIVAGLLITFNNYKATTVEGTPTYIGCTDQLWSWRVENCGLNGTYCSPFANQSFVIRCPTECLAVRNQNRRWLESTQQGFLTSWVVGSGSYRADSWLCPSAIHAGVVSEHWGGCAAIDIIGAADSFSGSSANGIDSMNFDSWFPKSYRIRSVESKYCTDFSWGILPVAVLFIALFPLLWPSRGAFVFALVTSGFWYGVFIAIPVHGESWTSGAFGNYFVTLAFTYYLYKLFIKPAMLSPGRFPIETFFLTIVPFYFALHMEILTAPMSNFGLTSRAFREPTTLITFAIGVPIVVGVCCVQLWLFRRHGLLLKYLLCYGLAIIVYFVLPLLIGLSMHLHHYTLGIILLPLTRLQNRASLLAQGFLIGLVVQGISRWGAASPFDTAFQNQAGDENVSIPRPEFAISPTALATNGTVTWQYGPDSGASIPAGLPYDAFSLVLNDMEVYRGPTPVFDIAQVQTDPLKTRPYYVRVALVASGSALEYSYPVTITPGGNVTYQNGTVASIDMPIPS
ncbi:hypothetical protein DFJ77DRAFT_480359 [Powellomyces hirtus]|nr:hypothetical protein DFJ77DRAFT_480359 [Powellomyces hirtus]